MGLIPPFTDLVAGDIISDVTMEDILESIRSRFNDSAVLMDVVREISVKHNLKAAGAIQIDGVDLIDGTDKVNPVLLPSMVEPTTALPSEYPSCKLWLSASQLAASLGLTPGMTVVLQNFTDVGPFANTFTQATLGKRPTLMHDGIRWVVRFDGVDDEMSPVAEVWNFGEFTCLWVGKTGAAGTHAIYSDYGVGLGPIVELRATAGLIAPFYRDNGARSLTHAGAGSSTAAHMAAATLRAATMEVIRNADAPVRTSLDSLSPHQMDGTSLPVMGKASSGTYGAIDVAEFCVFSEPLPSKEIAKLRRYFNTLTTLGLVIP